MPQIHLDWQGPVPLRDAPQQLSPEAGVYMFCLQAGPRYYAHYVGKAADLRAEVRYHVRQYLQGGSWLHDLDETERQDRLGRPIYNPQNRQACFDLDPPMQKLADRWVAKFVVFAAAVTDPPVPLRDIEGALAWAFRKDPRQDFTRYCDMCHAVKQTGVSAIQLTHSFQGPRVEGLP